VLFFSSFCPTLVAVKSTSGVDVPDGDVREAAVVVVVVDDPVLVLFASFFA